MYASLLLPIKCELHTLCFWTASLWPSLASADWFPMHMTLLFLLAEESSRSSFLLDCTKFCGALFDNNCTGRQTISLILLASRFFRSHDSGLQANPLSFFDLIKLFNSFMLTGGHPHGIRIGGLGRNGIMKILFVPIQTINLLPWMWSWPLVFQTNHDVRISLLPSDDVYIKTCKQHNSSCVITAVSLSWWWTAPSAGACRASDWSAGGTSSSRPR